MNWIAWNSLLLGTLLATTVNAAPQASAAEPEEPATEPLLRPVGASEVVVSEFMMVDIVAQNSYVTDILQKLAIQARRNIVPSNRVERLVSVNIYGLPLEDALTGLLEPNGLGFVERGEFIFVHTAAELEEMQVGSFAAVTRVIHLDYMRAVDAKAYVESLLSRNGTIEITKDFPDGKSAGGGGGAAGAIGGQVSDNTDIYSPEEDEYDLRNAIVVHDLPERVDKIEEFILGVDTRPAQIRIEASIIQTSLTEQNAFGVDFAQLGQENFVDYFTAPVAGAALGWTDTTDATSGETSTVVPGTGAGYVVSTPGNTGLGDATIRAGFVGDVGVFLRALDQVTDVTLLSNPKVMTLNRQRTKVFVGTRIGYFETTTVENQVIQTLKFLDAGIVLDVRPFVLKDGRVRLELSPKVSQVSFREVTQPDGSTQQIPDEQIQTVTTDILVPAGHTAVLGGLFREDTERSRSQVPFLGDVPVLGALFRGRDEGSRQTEVVFLVKAVVLEDEEIVESGLEAEKYRERVRVGSRLGLLHWSRERQSSRLNFEAERLLAEGDNEGARIRLRRSLGLYPQQPSVVKALERMDRKHLWLRDLSYVNQLIEAEYTSSQAEEGE
ncbi:MAG: type IV pilus assembly protein PilQ [Planctomycetota bacterium]|jgi:type IV pilus assembly protein PilQ